MFEPEYVDDLSQKTVASSREMSAWITKRMQGTAGLNDAAREERIEVHGEIVDGGATGFGDVFGAGARLGVKEDRGVADFDFFFGANLDNAVAGGN